MKYPIISSNIISGGTGFYKWGIQCFGYALIVDNTISDCNYGVYLYTQDMQFGGSIAPNAILERNKITGNTQGIHLEIYPARVYGTINPSIISNTISQNTIGIYIDGDSSKPILRNSNIQDNSNYNIQLKSSGNLNATYNWWGTTDTSSIDQTIFDSKRDFNLGTVNYTPYLTAPNTQATPDPNAPMPVPNSSISPSPSPSPSPEPEPTPSPSPDQSNTRGGTSWEFNGEVAVIAALVGVSVVLAIVLKKKQ